MTDQTVRQKYINPFRPHYEKAASIAWLTASASLVLEMLLPGASPKVLAVMALGCAAAALPWTKKWLRLMEVRDHMNRRDVSVIPIGKAKEQFDDSGKRIWLGWGFPWGVDEAQLAREVALADPTKLTQAETPEERGQSWIHGIGAQEEKIYLPVVDEHTLIIAMTRWGKTVLYRSLITQAIQRGEAVFVFDPKGDPDLKRACEQACHDNGKELLFFHSGFPATSVRLDPLKNYTDASELASRISGLLGRDARNKAFTDFAHMQLVSIINGMLLIGKRPTLVAIKRYLDGQMEQLLSEAIHSYCNRIFEPGWDRQLESYRRDAMKKGAKGPNQGADESPIGLSPAQEAAAYAAFYQEHVAEWAGSPEIEGLITSVKHPAEHRQKMLTSLLPLLTKLTSGSLGRMLSTDVKDAGDERLITDTARIVEQQQVIYIGLNALSDEDVANAVGEILLADLTAVCGTRYNYSKDKKIVSILIDEAPEILNDELIKLLNKGGGAGFRLTLATQTISDFIAKLGDRARAEKVLGNIANLIFGRVTAADSQTYFCDRLPRVPIKSMSHTRSLTTPTLDPLSFSATQGESLQTHMEPPIEPTTLGCLPQLHFFALLGSRFVKGRIPVIVPEPAA